MLPTQKKGFGRPIAPAALLDVCYFLVVFVVVDFSETPAAIFARESGVSVCVRACVFSNGILHQRRQERNTNNIPVHLKGKSPRFYVSALLNIVQSNFLRARHPASLTKTSTSVLPSSAIFKDTEHSVRHFT